jgi:hypothetical protein
MPESKRLVRRAIKVSNNVHVDRHAALREY